jgi:hypothetical protein
MEVGKLGILGEERGEEGRADVGAEKQRAKS